MSEYEFKVPRRLLEKEKKKAAKGLPALIEFEGTCAVYTKEERAMMRSLTPSERSFIHEMKVTFDAEPVEL